MKNPRKTFLFSLITFLIIFLGNLLSEGKPKEWTLLGESNSFNFYFDEEGMSTTPQGIITVWVRMVPQNKEAKKKYMEDRKEAGFTLDGYETYEYNQNLIKLNCPDLTSRIAQRIDFGKGGKVLGFHNFHSEWKPIPPRSAAEALAKLLCP